MAEVDLDECARCYHDVSQHTPECLVCAEDWVDPGDVCLEFVDPS